MSIVSRSISLVGEGCVNYRARKSSSSEGGQIVLARNTPATCCTPGTCRKRVLAALNEEPLVITSSTIITVERAGYSVWVVSTARVCMSWAGDSLPPPPPSCWLDRSAVCINIGLISRGGLLLAINCSTFNMRSSKSGWPEGFEQGIGINVTVASAVTLMDVAISLPQYSTASRL